MNFMSISKCPECQQYTKTIWQRSVSRSGCVNKSCRRYDPIVATVVQLQFVMRQIADNQIEPIMAEKARKCLEELEAK